MNPIKQRTPAGDGQGHTNIKRVKEWQDNIGKPSEPQALSCRQCAFHREIPDKRGHIRDHCQLTGEKSPQPGMDGCHFIQGKWDPERINFLTAGKSRNNLKFPNYTRPCSGLASYPIAGKKVARHSTAIHAYADIDGNKALHIGRAQRPHVREAAAASYRPGSVGALPFAF